MVIWADYFFFAGSEALVPVFHLSQPICFSEEYCGGHSALDGNDILFLNLIVGGLNRLFCLIQSCNRYPIFSSGRLYLLININYIYIYIYVEIDVTKSLQSLNRLF